MEGILGEPVSRTGTSNARTEDIKIERPKRRKALGGQRGDAMTVRRREVY
jgi:hypothetical protein